jgi:hypothetical protein
VFAQRHFDSLPGAVSWSAHGGGQAPSIASEAVAFTFTSIERTEENTGMRTTGLYVPVCNKEETTMNAEQLKGKWMQFKDE